MGFKETKKLVIKCIKDGAYSHEVRRRIDVKNVFQTGQISDEELIELIKSTNGNQYETSKHHIVNNIDIHILKPIKDSKKWYIKFYFLDPNTVFISVHESEF